MATFPISIESAGGEYMESVLVVSWAKRPGDAVKAGELLVTVETAKAATEVEAERDGFLADIHFAEGQEAPVGAVLGTLTDTELVAAGATVPTTVVETPGSDADAAPMGQQAPAAASGTLASSPSQRRLVISPLARRLARSANLDLSTVLGSGPNGRIKQRDITAALAQPKTPVAIPVNEAPDGNAPLGPPPVATPPRPLDPIVLLHGFAADSSLWRQVIPLLAAGRDVITIDLPGHGSAAATPAATIEEIALHVSDRLEAMGIARAHIVGHSLGGAAALSLCALGRVAVRSVTLFAPGGLGPEINGAFLAGLSGAANAEALDQWLGLMVADRAVLPAGYAAAAFRQLQRTGNAATLAAMADTLFPGGTQGFSLLPALAALTVPTRIVWGKADRVVPASQAVTAPGFAAVHLLDGVGHVPPIEAPVLAARLITETVLSAG